MLFMCKTFLLLLLFGVLLKTISEMSGKVPHVIIRYVNFPSNMDMLCSQQPSVAIMHYVFIQSYSEVKNCIGVPFLYNPIHVLYILNKKNKV